MRGSIKIAEVAGISINIHITFLLLVLIFGKFFFFVLAVFFFVTLHELAHSLVAKRFGIIVREITLLPIGGVASMTKMPEKPYQEFLIAIAGPLVNLVIVVVFFFPMKWIVGPEIFFAAFRSFFSASAPPLYSGAFIACQIYWINLILAGFNLLPAFPMDGGRILRSILAGYMGHEKATKIAVNFGHIFALVFGYIGLMHGRIILLIIALFIYMAASSEEMQVDVRARLIKFRVKDILSRDFVTVRQDATLSKVLEVMFHSRQEDFPVIDEDGGSLMTGFLRASAVMDGIHKFGLNSKVSEVMDKNVPRVGELMRLDAVQALLSEREMRALPVVRDGNVIGIVTSADIGRVYSMSNLRAKR